MIRLVMIRGSSPIVGESSLAQRAPTYSNKHSLIIQIRNALQRASHYNRIFLPRWWTQWGSYKVSSWSPLLCGGLIPVVSAVAGGLIALVTTTLRLFFRRHRLWWDDASALISMLSFALHIAGIFIDTDKGISRVLAGSCPSILLLIQPRCQNPPKSHLIICCHQRSME